MPLLDFVDLVAADDGPRRLRRRLALAVDVGAPAVAGDGHRLATRDELRTLDGGVVGHHDVLQHYTGNLVVFAEVAEIVLGVGVRVQGPDDVALVEPGADDLELHFLMHARPKPCRQVDHLPGLAVADEGDEVVALVAAAAFERGEAAGAIDLIDDAAMFEAVQPAEHLVALHEFPVRAQHGLGAVRRVVEATLLVDDVGLEVVGRAGAEEAQGTAGGFAAIGRAPLHAAERVIFDGLL